MSQSDSTIEHAGSLQLGTGIVIAPSPSTSTTKLSLGSCTTLTASGNLSIVAPTTSSISIGNDAVTANVNVGTGLLARTVSVGNTVGATSLVLNAGTGGLVVPTGTATQESSITTAVTLNAISGVITTVSATTAGAAVSTFTVNNSLVLSTSRVLAVIENYAGTYATAGLPSIAVGSVSAGSFTITIMNNHASNALSGVLKIAFLVLN